MLQKKFFIVILLIQFCLISHLIALEKVAEVADEQITWLELQKRYDTLWEEYQEDKSNYPHVSGQDYHTQLKKLALEELIEEKLFELYAEENGITISKQEVDAIFREIYATQSYFQTNGRFDPEKFKKFQEKHPERYHTIAAEIKKDFTFAKIKQIILEQFQVTDRELYRLYIRKNSEIKLKYAVVPDSLMPSHFPSTPFYLKKYYKKHRDNYQDLKKVKLRFVFVSDKEFIPEADSYQAFMKKYKNTAHKDAHEFAKKIINNSQLTHDISYTPRHFFTTNFLRSGDKIGNLEASEKIIKLALKMARGELFEHPIETENGWIVFQVEDFKTTSADNLDNIAPLVWKDYINKGKELYFNNLVKEYYQQNISANDIFKVNFDYLQIPVKSLDFNLDFTEDSTTVKEYYDKNITEYVTVRDTLALEKIREDVIEDLIEDSTKALTDSLLDTLRIQLEKNESVLLDSFPSIMKFNNQQVITHLPYFKFPLPVLIDTLAKTNEDSVFRINKDKEVFIVRVNQREKLSHTRKKRLKPQIEVLFKDKLYQERDEKFQKYYQANKGNLYENDLYKFQFLYVPIDTAGIKVSSKETKNYFKRHQNKYKVPAEIKLNTIFLPREKVDQIEEIKSALRAGVSIEFLTHLYNFKNDLAQKNYQYFPMSKLEPAIRDTLDNLRIGEISPVITTKYGLYLIKLLGRSGSYLPSFEEVQAEIRREQIYNRADSTTFAKIVSIYDSLETSPYYERYDSLGYVRTTDWLEIEEGEDVVLDSNLTIKSQDVEIVNRTGRGKILPKIFKENNGYAIIKIARKKPGKQITGYESYSRAKENFYKVFRYNQNRIFTKSLINRTEAGDDTLLNYLGGFKDSGWLTHADEIAEYKNSKLILFDAFSTSKGEYSNPIRFSDIGFGFYQVVDKIIEEIAGFEKVKDEYRQEYYQNCYQNWIENFKEAKDVIILQKKLRDD